MMFIGIFIVSVFHYAAAKTCQYKHDKSSPFYWKQQQNLCTDEICTQRNLNCIYPAEDIHDAVLAHRMTTGENIMYEIGILEKTFNASFPDEYFGSTTDYTCQGVCERPVTRLERIFYDYPQTDKFGTVLTSRQLCFVVGPKIHYSSCSGKRCNIKGIMGGTEAYHCVPDVTTSLTVWLFCPDVMPQCVKTTLEIPISCSCARFQCPTPKVDPLAGGQGLDLFGGTDLFAGLRGPVSGSDPFGAGSDPFGVSGPVDVLSGSNVDLGGMFQPAGFQSVDLGVSGQVGAGGVDPAMAGWNDQLPGQAQGVGSLGQAKVGGAPKIVK